MITILIYLLGVSIIPLISLTLFENPWVLAHVRADSYGGGMECGYGGILLDRRCDMNTDTWKSAFNTGYDMGRADGIAEMEKEAQDLRHEVDDLKQKLVDLALDYGRMLRKMGG